MIDDSAARHRQSRVMYRLALPVAVGTALAGTVWLATSAAAAPPPKNGKVTLCHARPPASAKNGWVQITVSTNAVTHAGHGQHDDDIIPSFSYYVKSAQRTYPGMNLTTVFGGSTGQQILANGCALPAAPPAPAPAVVTKSVAAPAPAPVVVTKTVPAPPPRTHTVVVHAPAAATRTVTRTTPAGTLKLAGTVVHRPAAAVEAVQASASAPAPAADRIGLAAGATGDHGGGVTDYVALYGGIGGAALAALLGMGGVAIWRRHRGAGAQL